MLLLLFPVCYHYLNFLFIWLCLGHPVLCTLRVSIHPWLHMGYCKLFRIVSGWKQHLQYLQQRYWRIYLCLLEMCYYYTAKNKVDKTLYLHKNLGFFFFKAGIICVWKHVHVHSHTSTHIHTPVCIIEV